ncbi:hypothetical protein MBRU_12900 [Mycolicibacterium brumae DSM 44177]|nr:hypothetical protein MBRU_12900 [Mycolicibacterium brumae DSM 44177]
MRVTILGCSGSVNGPGSPASGYLLTATGCEPLVIDFGGGVLGELQRFADPGDVNVFLSHLHADHCLDLPGLFVWRRYHPTNKPVGRKRMWGPADTWERLAAASSPYGNHLDDFNDIFEVKNFTDKMEFRYGNLDVLVRAMVHPTVSYGMRFTDSDGTVLVYSGDTGMCDAIGELAQGADVFLCEASWTHGPHNPPDLHLSGTEAGRIAAAAGVGELLITHIPPWTNREDVIAEAKAEYDGPIHAVSSGEAFDIRKKH